LLCQEADQTIQESMDEMEERIKHLENNEKYWRLNFKHLNATLVRLRKRFGIRAALMVSGET